MPSTEPSDQLFAYWSGNSQRIPLRSGAGFALIESFETSHSIRLPNDFAAYLMRADGFVRSDDPYDWSHVCDNGFHFYPLLQMERPDVSPIHFVFCHNEITLQEYAIQLGTNSSHGEISLVGDSALRPLAGSFSEFVQLYIAHSERLYTGIAHAQGDPSTAEKESDARTIGEEFAHENGPSSTPMGRQPRLSMQTQNPDAAPQADVADIVRSEPVDIRRMNQVASAQKFVICSLLAALAAAGTRSLVSSDVALLLGGLVTIVMMVGAVRLDGALNGSILSRILYALTMLLPLINLIIMFTLSLRASQELKAAGYTVGLLGAAARSDPS